MYIYLYIYYSCLFTALIATVSRAPVLLGNGSFLNCLNRGIYVGAANIFL